MPLLSPMPQQHKGNHLQVVAYGTPAPQGSKTLMRGRMVEANPRVRAWRATVTAAAQAALMAAPQWNAEHTAVVLHVTFTLPRPALHYRTGRYAHLLRPDAPVRHTRTPDLDKLVRAVGDALTVAGVWVDDSRVVRLVASKAYPTTAALPLGALDRPGVRIVVTGMGR